MCKIRIHFHIEIPQEQFTKLMKVAESNGCSGSFCNMENDSVASGENVRLFGSHISRVHSNPSSRVGSSMNCRMNS